MREFAGINNGLQTLRRETRVVYSLFLLTCLAGYIVIGLLIALGPGLEGQTITAHFRGDEQRMMYGKTYGELLELTHAHVFIIPLLVLVKGHLFMMTGWASRVKVAVVVAAFTSVILLISAPWLIRYTEGSFAWLLNFGRVAFALAMLLFIAVPLRDMWKRPASHG